MRRGDPLRGLFIARDAKSPYAPVAEKVHRFTSGVLDVCDPPALFPRTSPALVICFDTNLRKSPEDMAKKAFCR